MIPSASRILGALLFLGTLIPHHAAAVTLLHRYSFEGNTIDSVGGAAATLEGGAFISGGAVHFNGTSAYFDMDIGDTIEALTNFTIEAWVVVNSTQTWGRIFDFGNGTTTNMFLTPRSDGANTARFAITTTGIPGEQRLNDTVALPLDVLTHVMVTLDSASDTARFYVNGALVATNSSLTVDPANLGNTNQNYLGRSMYLGDPYLDGSISEFRIYGDALTVEHAAASFGAGTATVAVPEPTVAGLLLLGGAFAIASRRRPRRA